MKTGQSKAMGNIICTALLGTAGFVENGCTRVILRDLSIGGSPCAVAGAPFGGGQGTVSDPWQICSVAHLLNMETRPADAFTIESDLDVAGVLNEPMFEPISGQGFQGILDGRDHAITGLTIDLAGDSDVGLMALIESSAVVANLRLEGVAIVAGARAGALAGINQGVVSGVQVTGSVSASRATLSAASIGGLVGENAGLIENSSVSVTVSGGLRVGGMTGLNTGSILASSVLSTVLCGTHGSTLLCGGAVGENVGGLIEDTRVLAASMTGHGMLIGGFFGKTSGSVGRSGVDQVSISVAGASDLWSGGFAGEISGGAVVEDAWVSGSISGGDLTGGFAGLLDGASLSRIRSSRLFVAGNGYVGGFSGMVGASVNTVVDAYVSEAIVFTLSLLTPAAGFVAYALPAASLELHRCWTSSFVASKAVPPRTDPFSPFPTTPAGTDLFWDLNVSTLSSSSHTQAQGLTSSQMKEGQIPAGFFAAWDPGVWIFQLGQYPRLQW